MAGARSGNYRRSRFRPPPLDSRRPAPSASAEDPDGWSGTIGRVIPLPRPYAQVAGVGAGHLNLDFSPRAVGALVRGQVPDGVLSADLGDHLRVDLVQVAVEGREEGLSAGRFRDP